MTPRVDQIVAGLKACGVRFAASLPDQWLGPLLARLADDPDIRHIAVCREEEGLALCSGVVLGGEHAVLIAQNAGVLSSGTGLLTLLTMNRIPLLLLVSYRGSPLDPTFYHVPKGLATEPFFRALNVPYRVADDHSGLEGQVKTAFRYAQESQGPSVLLLNKEQLR